MPTDSENLEVLDSWDDAPCGLLRVDHRGIIQNVNTRFLNTTGHQRAELIGTKPWTQLLTAGSRLFFETQLAPVLELDGALEEVMLDLRAVDGRRVPALLSAVTIRDASGQSMGARIAVLAVPDRRKYEEELRAAQRQAEQATASSASSRRRLELLAQANAALASSVDVDVALRRLAAVLVTQLADWCLIYAADDTHPDNAPRWAAAHIEPDRQSALNQLAVLLPVHATTESALDGVLAGGVAVLLDHVSEEHKMAATDSGVALELFETLGLASALVVPSTARGSRVATIILARGGSRPAFTSDDLTDVTDLGARTGIVIDNLRQYAREHSNSVALQQALLTSAPATPMVEIATRYLPATDGAEVGGDWYDAFILRDRTPVVVIGDVVGHGIQAAAAMGQLRGLIRSLAYAMGDSPAHVLSAADEAARGLRVSSLATAVVAQLRWTQTPGQATFTWSNAGHPAPILITAHGEIRLLHAASNLLLGVTPATTRTDQSIIMSAGDTVVLYTDGLIERPDEDLDVGVARLAAQLHEGQRRTLDELCDAALAGHEVLRRDDIALIGVRLRAN